MRLASLGSGSRGNATLIESGDLCLLIDCGLSISRVQRGLQRLGRSLDDLTAIAVTHEHSDHVAGVERLARRLGLTVWMSAGTASALTISRDVEIALFSSHQPLVLNGVLIHPFPVPHDAREPTQFIVGDDRCRVGVLTDLGSVTPHVVEMLSGCDALFLECNHDPDLLRQGDYPALLKRRVGGDWGHLSNLQAADLLARLDHARLRCVVAAHLSEKNNHPDLAIAALHGVLGDIERLRVADQETGLDWVEVD